MGEGIPLYNHSSYVQLRTENATFLRIVGIESNVRSHLI